MLPYSNIWHICEIDCLSYSDNMVQYFLKAGSQYLTFGFLNDFFNGSNLTYITTINPKQRILGFVSFKSASYSLKNFVKSIYSIVKRFHEKNLSKYHTISMHHHHYICRNCGNLLSNIFGKNFVKVTVLLKELLNS